METNGVRADKLSEYEISRLERIKENEQLINQLFTEGTKLAVPVATSEETNQEETPEKKFLNEGKPGGLAAKRRLKFPSARRNPRRSARSLYADNPRGVYDGPMTRGMRHKLGGKRKLSQGLTSEPELKRVSYRTTRVKRILPEEEPISVEIDGKPGMTLSGFGPLVTCCKDKVYDKVNGSTCHQCRQKTLDQKTVCHNKNCSGVKGQFCGPCLKNRYGEDIRKTLLDSKWVCPPCRGICNCSFCLPKKGCPPTGIMIHIAKEAGFDSVREYLERSNYKY